MAKKMTMADIANLSGVGKSTVSRYFNGGYVKDETRAKIQKVIEEYNYTPNAFARLNAKQSNVIGVVVPTLNSKITSRVITSIDRYLREKGYTTLIQNSDHDIDQELQNIRRLIQLNVDGILISSIAITKDHKELLKKAGIPVVVLTQDYEDGISIIYDDYHAGKTIGEYIGKKGHQKVGISIKVAKTCFPLKLNLVNKNAAMIPKNVLIVTATSVAKIVTNKALLTYSVDMELT